MLYALLLFPSQPYAQPAVTPFVLLFWQDQTNIENCLLNTSVFGPNTYTTSFKKIAINFSLKVR